MIHLGTPCTTWSISRTTGRPQQAGTSLARFTASLINLCAKHGVYISLENPKTSKLFKWGPLQRSLKACRANFLEFDSCAFGTPWKKPTYVATSLPRLLELSRSCRCCAPHVRLQGLVRCGRPLRWTWLTRRAGCYSPQLSRRWAALLREAAPASALDASCSVSAHWEADLSQAVGGDAPDVAFQPKCPARFKLPWSADAEFALGGGSSGGRRQFHAPRLAGSAGSSQTADARGPSGRLPQAQVSLGRGCSAVRKVQCRL